MVPPKESAIMVTTTKGATHGGALYYVVEVPRDEYNEFDRKRYRYINYTLQYFEIKKEPIYCKWSRLLKHPRFIS